MGSFCSPQSIFNIGHRAIKDLFTVPVQLQEKVDGSFFAFGYYPNDEMPWKIRSKGAIMYMEAPVAMFKSAMKSVEDRKDLLHYNWQYRAEVLSKPKHNALAYDRTPKDNLILFDVLTDEETYLSYEDLAAEAARLGFEVVPQLFSGSITDAAELRKYMNTISILGGQAIEGVVVKPLVPMFGQDKKMLFGKFVSEAFKEVHKNAWGESNPGKNDVIDAIGKSYGTQARWQKALIHLREAGLITNELKDIGLLIREVPLDILKENEDEIKEALFKHFWPFIKRVVGSGLPQWYKELLLTEQFEAETEANKPPFDPDPAIAAAESEGMTP